MPQCGNSFKKSRSSQLILGSRFVQNLLAKLLQSEIKFDSILCDFSWHVYRLMFWDFSTNEFSLNRRWSVSNGCQLPQLVLFPSPMIVLVEMKITFVNQNHDAVEYIKCVRVLVQKVCKVFDEFACSKRETEKRASQSSQSKLASANQCYLRNIVFLATLGIGDRIGSLLEHVCRRRTDATCS